MKKFLVSTICSLALLSACSPASVAVGAGSTVGIGAMQERGLKQSAKDTYIEAAINRLLFAKNVDDYFRPLTITVHEGRVLMAGNVKNPDIMVDAIKMAWSVDGVKEVINEIKVDKDTGLAQDASDVWTAAQIRTKITFDKKISAINYSIEVINGVVYLMGIAKGQEEIDRVVAYAEGSSGTQKVISYVRVEEPKTATAAAPDEAVDAPSDAAPLAAPQSQTISAPTDVPPAASPPPSSSVDDAGAPVEFVN